MGFYDAFNPQLNWTADSYLAIDQGPIINMIENHRSGLLWKHFMANAEIQTALKKIGFSSDVTKVETLPATDLRLKIYPNPVKRNLYLFFVQPSSETVKIELCNTAGQVVHRLFGPTRLHTGPQRQQFTLPVLAKGTYFLHISSATYTSTYPLLISQ
jgi:uncharacterized protein (UPF0128 family)